MKRLPYINLFLIALTFMVSAWLYSQTVGEVAVRVDQTCRIFEQNHRSSVSRYKSSLDYLVKLPPAERNQGINRAVLKNLPVLRQETLRDKAPAYCNEPGVGLPGPEPSVPRDPFVEKK